MLSYAGASMIKRPSTAARSSLASFSQLAATAPFERFTLEVNPLKLGADAAAAVDGLLIIE